MNYLIPAALTLTVTIISGLVLWLIKRERVSLLYEMVSSDIFPVKEGVGKYYIIRLINAGNKHIENINLTIDFPYGMITSVATSHSEILSETQQEESSFKTKISLLNPKEYLSLTITTESNQEPQKPKLLARAVGVTAVRKKDVLLPENIQNIVTGIAVAVTASVALTTWNSFRVPKFEKEVKDSLKQLDSSKFQTTLTDLEKRTKDLSEKLRVKEEKSKAGDPETEQIIFSILNKSGLTYLLPEIINKSGDNITYWKTGMLLMFRFVADSKRQQNYISAMEQIITIDGDRIAPSSKGFNLYLLSKMCRQRGDALKANEYLNKCKAETPLMFNHLIEQDQFFDVKAIEKIMRSNQSN